MLRAMRRLAPIILGILPFVLAACGSSETTTPVAGNRFAAARVGTDTTLEVMTWNLKQFPLAYDTTVDLVTEAIEGLAVDIIAVQEIYTDDGHPGRSAFTAVADALEAWDGYQSQDNNYMDLGFFYRTDSDLVVESFTDIFAGREFSGPFPRAPLVMQASWRGLPIVVINNHLKAFHDQESIERRRQACLLLEQYVTEVFPDSRVFIVGDMNDELTDAPPDTNVFANFLADTLHWRFADMAIAQGQGGLVSWPHTPSSHIDHLLVTDELFTAVDKAGTFVQVLPLVQFLPGSSYYDTLSDHLPVVIRLEP